jgi:hypothetical protein
MNSLSLSALTGLALCGAAITASAQAGFAPAVSIPAPVQPSASVLFDMDGDGDLDLGTTADTPDRVLLFANSGDGTFTLFGSTALGGGVSPQELTAADLDGDLDQDLLVGLKGVDRVQALTNSGGGVFTLGASFTTGSEPRHVSAGDLDGDGDMDVVASNKKSDSITVAFNNGAGSFGAPMTLATGAEPRHAAIGDLDGDGDNDLAVAAHDSNQLSVFLNQGGGSFVSGAALSTGIASPDGVVIVDLDGDGDNDVATDTSKESLGINQVTVFTNGGGGAFGGPTNYPVGGLNPSSVVAADFDLDGTLDFATANKDSNDISVLLGTQSGGFVTYGPPQLFAAGTEPEHLVAGDTNGDGSPDLVSTNKLSNDVSLLLNQASGAQLSLFAPAVIGSSTTLILSAPDDPGQLYFCGFSFGTTPGTPLPGGKLLPLNIDSLFIFASRPSNGVFQNTIAALDGGGQGLVGIALPFDPSLVGVAFSSAFLTLDAFGGVDSVSPALGITIQ